MSWQSVLPGMLEKASVVNVASVPHRSPFRYPGGKTWLVPLIRKWLTSLSEQPNTLGEPFCGGAIVGLSTLFEGLVKRLILVELDDDVAAVWETMLNGNARELVAKIAGFVLTRESVEDALNADPRASLDRAFVTILRNRVQRGGILAPGASLMKDGEAGHGIASRWYPQTLQGRIEAIHSRRSAIRFIHGDGMASLRHNAHRKDMVFFIDPPYTVAGHRLYAHSDINHEELFRIASQLQGDFLMTYDEAEPIGELAQRFGFDVHSVPMKNTHHRVMHELLIGRDLSWARA
jgi:DNA adenine methylase